jgi:8-oxo-dGTP pyrophosphatase MutT (NUDIX family)
LEAFCAEYAAAMLTWKGTEVNVKLPAAGDVLEQPVTDRLLEAIGAHLANPPAVPAVPRLAATVMLVRDAVGPAGEHAEVFMIRRAATMAFMPDAVVFPGGRVDNADSDPDLPWSGPSPADWARWLHLDEAKARGVVVAAAREVFEECGILLAGPTATTVVTDLTAACWSDARARLDRHEVGFAAVLREHGLVLRSDLLGLRSNWRTPDFEPRRYDTFFFAALVPPGQVPNAAASSEAADDRWATPARLFAQADAGEILLLPPTKFNLAFLAHAASAESFVLERPMVHKIELAPHVGQGGVTTLQAVLH